MSGFKSNIDEFVARLERLPRAARIDDPALGAELGSKYTEMLTERVSRQHGPVGETWAANEPTYLLRKGGLPVGVGLTGEMLAPENLRVTATVVNNSIALVYAGSPVAEEHMRWFEAGGRQVWGIDESMKREFKEIIHRHIKQNLRKR